MNEEFDLPRFANLLGMALAFSLAHGVCAVDARAQVGADPAAPVGIALSRQVVGPGLASGQPDSVVIFLDEVGPGAADLQDGINRARVDDLRAFPAAAAASRKTVYLEYTVVRENVELATAARMTVIPFTEQRPAEINPAEFVNPDALQARIDKRDAALRVYNQRSADHARLFKEAIDGFLHTAIGSVQAHAKSARETLAVRTNGEPRANDVAGALKAASARARLIGPKARTILVINSSLVDNVSFRWNRTSLRAEEFPGTIGTVVLVNTSFAPDRRDFLRSPHLEIHHRNTLAEAAILVGDLLNR